MNAYWRGCNDKPDDSFQPHDVVRCGSNKRDLPLFIWMIKVE